MTQDGQRVLLLDVVGLTPRALEQMPLLRRWAGGSATPLRTVLPAVTCSVQSTMLTGRDPGEHGAVGNGWFFRDLGEIMFWRQPNSLVDGPKVWDALRRSRPDAKVANVCWWYAMGADVDTTITPRPVYHADGRKSPDAYTVPDSLRSGLLADLGPFPLFRYWGPTASIDSSRWIVEATRRLLPDHDLTLAYVPHLDYDHQRYGPGDPRSTAAAAELDRVIAPLLADADAQGVRTLVVSEYGITDVDRPVDVNRVLRREGLLQVHTQAGMEYLDPWTSRAFAVADHQVAHVYVRDPADRERVATLLAGVPGVEQVLDRDAQHEAGIGHARSGDLVVVADARSWFTYYYWLDDERAPDFARGVDIHRKPGYDPAELFFDPADRSARARAGLGLVRKAVGLRYAMSVVPLDPTCVRGSHGRLPDDDADGPVVLSAGGLADLVPEGTTLRAHDVHDLVLAAAGVLPALAR